MEINYFIQRRILNMKKTLALEDVETIVSKFRNDIDYILFLDHLGYLEFLEMPFLLLDSNMINKIRTILNDIRYKTENEGIICKVNSHIIGMNKLENFKEPVKSFYIRDYVKQQEMLHKVKFLTPAICMNMLANDQVVLDCLLGKEESEVSNLQLCASINYFLETMPLIFSNNFIEECTMRLTDVEKSQKIIFQKTFVRKMLNSINDKKKNN